MKAFLKKLIQDFLPDFFGDRKKGWRLKLVVAGLVGLAYVGTVSYFITHRVGGSGSGLVVTTQTQSGISGGPPNNQTETDVTWTDGSGNGWRVGLIPGYGGALISPWYEVNSNTPSITQTNLATSNPDGFLHMFTNKAGTFLGSEDAAYTLTEQAPTGTSFRRYYSGRVPSAGNDGNGFNWTVKTAIYPGDPGFLVHRIDINNPSGSAIGLAGSDGIETAMIGGLQQTGQSVWSAGNGGYGTVGGSQTSGWPSSLTTVDPDYFYILPAGGSGITTGVESVRKTSLTSTGASNIQIQYLLNSVRLKVKAQATLNSFPANTTKTLYYMQVLRRGMTAGETTSIAADYLNPDTPTMTVGTFGSFSYDEGLYQLTADHNTAQFTHNISGNVTERWMDIYKLSSYTASTAPVVKLGGTLLTSGTDYLSYVDTSNQVAYVKLMKPIVSSGANNNQFNNLPLQIYDPATGPYAPSGVVPNFDHIITIIFENQNYTSIVGNNAQAPYINGLINNNSLATNYFAVTHPSLPNYIDLTAGTNGGITTDCNGTAPGGSGCNANVSNIADLVENSGRTWKAYMESMGSACAQANSGNYAVRHNPFVWFQNIRTNSSRCNSNDVDYSNLATDLGSTSTTPNYVWITPNACNDMHDCSIATGDTWLSNNLPTILNSAAYTNQNTLVIVTWDEDNNSTNKVPTIMVGRQVKTIFSSATSYNHYSLLHTIESAWGLTPLTSNDTNAALMSDFFTTSMNNPATPPSGSLSVVPTSGAVPLGVTANGSGSTSGTNSISTYTFDFGDGTTVGPQAGSSASHTYNAAGAYTVTMTVTDTASLTSIKTASVTASNAPTAALNATPSSGPVPINVTADASGSTAGSNPISSYTFDFGDGTVVGPQANSSATRTYTTAGTYTVNVTVTDSISLSSSTSQQVVLSNPASPPPPSPSPSPSPTPTPSSPSPTPSPTPAASPTPSPTPSSPAHKAAAPSLVPSTVTPNAALPSPQSQPTDSEALITHPSTSSASSNVGTGGSNNSNNGETSGNSVLSSVLGQVGGFLASQARSPWVWVGIGVVLLLLSMWSVARLLKRHAAATAHQTPIQMNGQERESAQPPTNQPPA